MFTGLIEATGRIERVEPKPVGRQIRVASPLAADLDEGESIAVDGVCLTAVRSDSDGFEADVSPETERVTTLGGLEVGAVVNLERPVRADARLGGHFVLGHVDGLGRVVSVRSQGDHHWLEVEIPAALTGLVIAKGSIAIDGISLTVASLSGRRVGVQVVPFTFARTALADRQVGQAVNIEVDVLGKYVARLLGAALEPAAQADVGRKEP
jgi:riboflavin synthase